MGEEILCTACRTRSPVLTNKKIISKNLSQHRNLLVKAYVTCQRVKIIDSGAIVHLDYKDTHNLYVCWTTGTSTLNPLSCFHFPITIDTVFGPRDTLGII
jgi:hypothetical protein